MLSSSFANRIARFLAVCLLLATFFGCKKDDVNQNAVGSFFVGANQNEIILGNLNQNGSRNTLVLNTRTGAILILEFEGSDTKAHLLTNTNFPKVSYTLPNGELFESLDGLIQISKFEQPNNDNITIEGLFEARLVNISTGAILQINNGNFLYTKN